MKTKSTAVEGTVSIWAVPMYQHEIDNLPEGSSPFKYSLHTSSQPWENGAVKVCEHEVVLDVPAGIDLLAKAVETLEKAIEDRRAQYHEEIHQIQGRINELLLIEYKSPATDGPDLSVV